MTFNDFKSLAAEYGYADAIAIPGMVVLAYPYTPFKNETCENSNTVAISAYYLASTKETEAAAAFIEALRLKGVVAQKPREIRQKRKTCYSGMGFYGRNQLIIHPKLGSYFKIEIFELEHDWCGDVKEIDCDKCPDTECERTGFPKCGNCDKCVKACPTGALTGTGLIHEKCIRSHMISGKVVPEELREAMGNRLVGCDICQRACPHNSLAKECDMPEEYTEVLSLQSLLSTDDAEFKATLEKLAEVIGSNYAKPTRIRSQAIICAGNSGNRAMLGLLEELRGSSDEAVSSHLDWAIDKLKV